MDPICRNILNHLRHITPDSDTVLTFFSDKPYIGRLESPDVYFDYSKSKYRHEIGSILTKLEDDGYIANAGSPAMFTLTHKGLHPYWTTWETAKKFLFNSVFVPISVSVATSIIVLWLQGLL